jgi:type II secretory pathway component PulC
LLRIDGRCVDFTQERFCFHKLGRIDSPNPVTRVKGLITVEKSFRDFHLSTNLSNLLLQAGAEPVLLRGEITGFRIFDIDEGSPYQALGLQNEDEIRSLNGVLLTDLAKTIQLLESLRTQDHIDIEAVREGKRLAWSIKFL